MQPKNKPEKRFRYGAVCVSIWRDEYEGPKGQAFESNSVTLDRAYKDRDGQWKHTNSLKENDIPKAIAALEEAFKHMSKRESEPQATEQYKQQTEVSEEKVE
jgi:hypothetical protein